MKHQRYSHSTEFRHYLDHFCQPRKPEETPLPGDIAAIRKRSGSSFEEVHGFTFIDQNIACSKNGLTSKTSCILKSLEDVTSHYGVTQGCAFPKPKEKENCEVFVDYFQCRPSQKPSHSLDGGLAHCAVSGDLILLPELIGQFYKIRDKLEKDLHDSYDFQLFTLTEISPPTHAVRRGKRAELDQIDFTRLDGGQVVNLAFEAIDYNQPASLQALLDKGSLNPNAFIGAKSLLYLAAERSRPEIVRLLLDRGAEVDLATNTASQDTPLSIAAEMNHLEVLRELLKRGANANASNSENSTPLYYAAHRGHVEVVRELLKHGADANGSKKAKYTPLHAAARLGHTEIVRELLHHNATVDSSDRYGGNTPLLEASRKGHLEIVRELLKKGANPIFENRRRETPLSVATQGGHTEVVELLKNAASAKKVK